MDPIDKMRDDMNYYLRQAKEITDSIGDGGVLTPEQKETAERHMKDAKAVEDKINEMLETRALQDSVKDKYESMNTPQARKVPQASIQNQDDQHTHSFRKPIEVPSVNPATHASFKGQRGAEDAHKSGLWFLSNVFGRQAEFENHHKVLEASRLIRDYYPEMREDRALSTIVSTAGGVTVPQEFANAIIERREQFGVFERMTNRVPMNNESSWPRVTTDQMASFSSEGNEITAVDAAFDNITLNAKSLKTLTRINNELLNESAVNIAEFVASDFGRRFAKRIDTAGFTGDGSAANGGIVGCTTQFLNNTGHTGYYKPGSCDNFADVTTAMLATMSSLLPQYAAMSNPFWITNQAGKELMFGRLQMASGGVTKMETALGTLDTYSGIPIATAQVMPGSSSDFTNLDVMFLLADLRLASFMGVTQDVTISRSSERYFEFDQTGMRGTMRTDINVYDIGSTTQAGSIIAMISD